MKISVIIPIYNAQETISDTISSVLNQTYQDVEVVCIDDCSTDESVQIIEDFVASNQNIRLIKQEKNAKTSAARNRGIHAASGELILPLDADDTIDPTYCEKIASCFKFNPSLTVVYSLAYKFDETNRWDWELPSYDVRTLCFENMVFCSAAYRKASWEKLGGYDEKMISGLEDWEFWLNMSRRIGQSFYRIPEPLFNYRQSQQSRNSVVSNKSRNIEIYKYVRKKHLFFILKVKIRSLFFSLFE